MGTPFLSEIRIFSFNFAPKGWAFCNGQTLPINQNQALFSLLGTNYGGNGTTTFQLPDLRGRIPFCYGGVMNLAERAGSETNTLSLSEMPAHTHQVTVASASGTAAGPVGNVFASSSQQPYTSNPSSGGLNPASVSSLGGSQPHSNLPPYTVLNFCIALQGIFPSQN